MITRRHAVRTLALVALQMGLNGCRQAASIEENATDSPRDNATSDPRLESPTARARAPVPAREKIGDYLSEANPVDALWHDLLDIVFRDSPNRPQMERLSPSAQNVYYVLIFGGELINGGLIQFYENTAGEHAHETLRALEEIRATISADLLKKSFAAFPKMSVPKSQSERYDVLSEFREKQPDFLDKLDDEYRRRVDDGVGGKSEEDVLVLLLEYMKAKRQESVRA